MDILFKPRVEATAQMAQNCMDINVHFAIQESKKAQNRVQVTWIITVQYCAKVTQAKCANFVLCSHALSRKVRVKVRVTIQGLLSKISLEQRTIFLQTFGTKRNFTMTSVVSRIQCPKFRV